MAVTKKNVNGAFYFTYPSSDVFLKERNYFVFEGVQDDTYIKTVNIGNKTLNFGRYALDIGATFYLDVSAYYAKYNGKFNVVIKYENFREEVVTTTITINATTYDCYSPFLEVVPDRCGDAPYARIVPPYRMLWDGKKETSSLLSAMRDGDYFSGYEYEMEGVPYENFRPSNTWVTTSQKNEHLGETYRNTLKSNGNLAELEGNGLPMWIEQGLLRVGSSYYGKTFEEQRAAASNFCRTKTIFTNYNGLKIGASPSGIDKLVIFYNANKEYVGNNPWTSAEQTLNNASDYPYISIIFHKKDNTAITPSELTSLTSTELTNPDAGKSWRWYNIGGAFKWEERTQEQLVNNKFYWEVNNESYSDDVINKGFTFGDKFSAKLILSKNITSPTSWTPLSTIYSIDRYVELVDSSMHYLYARWLTPWGISVEHLFYLDTYGTEKDNAQEVESEYLYEEHSKHVIKGSFYLDNIRAPYDLWYYQTLANSELVELYLPIFSVRKDIYMPNASDYVAVKIKGSNIKDAVVDGVAQSTITFDFELR